MSANSVMIWSFERIEHIERIERIERIARIEPINLPSHSTDKVPLHHIKVT
jgi:hypothetical protein